MKLTQLDLPGDAAERGDWKPGMLAVQRCFLNFRRGKRRSKKRKRSCQTAAVGVLVGNFQPPLPAACR